jgi:hypothetical protein
MAVGIGNGGAATITRRARSAVGRGANLAAVAVAVSEEVLEVLWPCGASERVARVCNTAYRNMHANT